LVQISDLTQVMIALIRSDNRSEGSWLCCRKCLLGSGVGFGFGSGFVKVLRYIWRFTVYILVSHI